VEETELKAEEERERQREQEVQDALAKMAEARTSRDLRAIRDDLRWAYNDERIVDAIDAAAARILEEEERREAGRAEAERERFLPFACYQVEYALVAEEEGEGEPYLDTRWVDALLPVPDAGGWWYPLRGRPFRLTHPVRVERVVVLDVEHVPDGCPCEQTEWGAIRVPPAGCEGLDNGMLS